MPICQCSALVEQCQHLGVEGYRVENYQAAGFLNRYLPISIPHAPMLIYKKDIRIPLVFRRDSHVQMVLNESWRLEAYFRLVDWFLADDFEAEKIVFGYSAACCPLRRFRGPKMMLLFVSQKLLMVLVLHCKKCKRKRSLSNGTKSGN